MTHVLPFRQFVLKVHSRCDLACDHCYVYEHADQSWRARPKTISEQTAELVAQRIADHAAEHQLPVVHVVLHGGEPLLLGAPRTRSVLSVLRQRIEPVTRLDLRIHTNGVLLDGEFCALFREFDVKIGVSLDGDRAANDRHRRFANGRTSHPQVLRALELVRQPEFAHLYAGILCTIDIANDPIAVYEALAAERPPRVDLLLPHATWDIPPARSDASRTEYADWLTAIYDRWTADGRPFGIRTFDSILGALRGEPSQTESLGLTPTDLLVIETDGAMEQADSLKTAFDGAAATGFDVVRHSFDEAARHEGIEARQQGLGGLCDTCRQCPVVNVCGGGLYAHRYRTGTGFANPSAYCEDLKATILHIAAAARGTAAAGGGDDFWAAHTLTLAEFDALATGCGSADTIGKLAEAQHSIRRELIAGLIAATHADDDLAAAGNLLVRLDREAPEAVSAVLAHPLTRNWATECLNALTAGESAPNDIGYLSNLAIAAAARTGVSAQLAVYVIDDTIRLPTLGYAEISGRGKAVVAVEHSQIKIERDGNMLSIDLGDPAPEPAWHPVSRLCAASGLAVDVDADTLDAKLLQDSFPEAVSLLEHCLPDHLPGLRAGVTTLVPPESASCETVGVVAVAATGDPLDLAIGLLRGSQRAKLHGILDLFELVEPGHRSADADADAEELIRETFEQLAVADFQRARRAQFDDERRRVTTAIGQLHDHPELTVLGRRFVERMARTAASWSTPDARAVR